MNGILMRGVICPVSAVEPDGDPHIPGELPNQIIHTDVIVPMDEAMGFGPDSYHGGDYSLWYSNIESNVQLRVDRYLSEH